MSAAKHARLAFPLALLAATTLLLAAAAPSQAAPAWRIDSLANTNSAPGGTQNYLVQLTNAGDEALDGTAGDPIALHVSLPEHITAKRSEEHTV